jgi:hypothetical protein
VLLRAYASSHMSVLGFGKLISNSPACVPLLTLATLGNRVRATLRKIASCCTWSERESL